MSSVIDNVKVGNHIKQLLKKHHMTQSDLADKLSISKSALSQNLNGRSTFDIENLMNIAKLFNISLDELISGQKENKHFISDYQKIVEKGLDGIKNTSVIDLRVAEPDFYGKVLVDYIIDEEKWDMLIFLHNQDVKFTYDYFRRAKEIYLNVILSLLEHDIKDVIKYFIEYQRVKGNLLFHDEKKAYLIWQILNKPTHQDVVKQLIHTHINQKKKLFNLIEYKQSYDLISKAEVIEIISKYKLNYILLSFIQTIHKDEDFSDTVDSLYRYQFFEGIKTYIQHFKNKDLSIFKKATIGVQKSILMILEDQHYDLVIDFLENRLYTNLTEILKIAIETNQSRIASHIIANFRDEIIFKKIGEYCIDYKNIELLDKIFPYLSNEDLDYLLAYTKPKDIESMMYLVRKGARIEYKYHNMDTYDKVNEILDNLMKSEDK